MAFYVRRFTTKRDLTYHLKGCRHTVGRTDVVEVDTDEVIKACDILNSGQHFVNYEGRVAHLVLCGLCIPRVDARLDSLPTMP